MNRRSVCSLLVVAGLAASAAATPTYTTIALTGVSNQYGPNMGPGVVFNANSFNPLPVVSNSGNVAFRSNVTTTATAEGMWVFGGGANYNVAIAGGPRPGGGTYPTGGSGVVNQMSVNDNGEWFMRLQSSTGVFSSAGGTPGRVALAGDVAPGVGGATYAASAIAAGMPLYNNNGQTAFIGTLSTGSGSPAVTATAPNANNTGLWVGTPASQTLVLRQNSTSSLFDAGQAAGESRLGTLQSGSLSFNNNGAFVTSCNLQGANIITSISTAGQNNGAIITNRGGSLEVIARAGAAAPDETGAPGPYYFRGTPTIGLTGNSIAFNNAGRVAFVCGLRDGGTTQVASNALFTDLGGTLRLVGRNGAACPTVYNPSGSVDTDFNGVNWQSFTAPVINSQNVMAFSYATSSLTAYNGVITMDASGRMTSIAQTGDTAVPGGQPLTGLDAHFGSFSNVQINAAGQIVFNSTLLNEGGIFGGIGGNNSGVFGWDPVLGMQLIARTGDQFTVAPGDVRTISGIGGSSSTGGQDGRLISLNNSGQFGLTLYFTDGSAGVFLATIPTPGAAGLLALAGVAAARRRR